MEDNIIEFKQLANNWKCLYQEIKRKKKISFDMFNSTFQNTYHLLAPKALEPNIEKKYLEVIVNASLFAHIDAEDNMESKYKAALVLTERMLNTVIGNSLVTPSSETVIYILELRQEIYINFDNVSESIDTLTKLYENEYWTRTST